MLRNINAVLFDLDGSLVDSMWIWKDIDREYLGRFNIPLPEDLQSSIEGMSFSETAVYFKEHFPIPDSIEQMKSDWTQMARDKYLHEVPLKNGADLGLPPVTNVPLSRGFFNPLEYPATLPVS